MLLKDYIGFLQSKPQDINVEVNLVSDSHSNKVQVNTYFSYQQEPGDPSVTTEGN
jgi:hypothetical protein